LPGVARVPPPIGVGPVAGTNGPAPEPDVEHCAGATDSTKPACAAPGGMYCMNCTVDGVRPTVVTVTDPATVVATPATA
jgi:hypothetical protein